MVCPQPRTYGNGIIAADVGRQRGEDFLVVVNGEHSFGDGGLHDAYSTAWHMHGQETNTGSQTGTRREYGGTHFAATPCHEQRMTIIAFMALGEPIIQEREHR